MPELLRQQILGRMPRGWRFWSGGWLFGGLMSVVALPALAADALPATVRACSTVTDSLQRLVCYDREVAKFPAPAAKAAEKSAPAGQVAAAGGSTRASATQSAALTPGAASSTSGPSAATAPAATAAQAGAGTNNPGPTSKPDSTSATIASGDDHVVAHIASIDRQPNEMVLHLDNGQVWQEVQSVSGDLSLREGDAIKIDRHFGSFWLTGPHVSSMKVQRKT